MQPLVIPPFRTRGEPHRRAVVQHLFDSLARSKGLESVGLHPEAMRYLSEHPAPGNIREIRDGARKALLYAMREQQMQSQPFVTFRHVQRAMFDGASAYDPQDATEIFSRPGLRVLAPVSSDQVTIVVTPSEIRDDDFLRLVQSGVVCGIMRHVDSQVEGATKLGCSRATLRALLREAGMLPSQE